MYAIVKIFVEISGKPSLFKFNESTNIQVKKQFDGCVRYWLSETGQIVNSYCGSLFVRHCTSGQLMEHFKKLL